LRTSFLEVERQPVQVVVPDLTVSIEVDDFTQFPDEVREAELRRRADEEVQRLFTLAKPPLLRLNLFTLGPEEHVLLAVMHHIISDGWSLGIFVHELTELYAAFASGEFNPLPAMEIQYGDYAVWQREWLRGDILQSQVDYWKARLSGAPPVLYLPADRPYPKNQSYQGSKLTLTLSPSLTEKVRRMTRSEGVTLFMTLLAAYEVLLCHLTKQTDMVVGTGIAGRNYSEIESLIGFFVNTLALRTDLSGDPDFRELLRRIREACLEAYAHQDVPFEKLVEELQPKRDPVHPPIVQVMFVLENAPLPELRLSNLVVAPVTVDSASAKFPLALLAYEAGESITCVFEYNTALFDKGTISLMAKGYEMVLEQVTKQPAVRLGTLDEALRKIQEAHLRQEESRYDEVVRGKLMNLTRRIAG
jgi:hypothetical protein